VLDKEIKNMYRVYKYNTCCVLDDVGKMRKNKEAYDLWIDVPLKEFREKEKGDIDLLQKRILGRLLLFLIINANKDYTPTELYRQVWCLKSNGLNEDISVRTNISRLRDLLEPDPPRWKYVQKTETSFLSGKGAYFFDGSSSYCLIIREDTFALFL
jgi:hypothetical protein